ncbi:MAG: MarC family protein [Treponema sp.]|jgi:multiple antibiotic resistance protein|nr:MarC family protein [Treponema sp.]
MLSLFLPVFFTIFIVIDPIGIVPLYMGLSSYLSPRERKKVVNKAVIIAFIVQSVFVFLGKWILTLLQIEPGAFFIAGGIMLFMVSLEMLFGKPSRSKISAKEGADNDEGHSVAIFPLAIPMLSGPGAITAIILFTGSGEAPLSMMIALLVSIALTLAVAWLSLRSSGLILKVLGKTGVSVVERIIGLILSGLSVQFVYNGIIRLALISGI